MKVNKNIWVGKSKPYNKNSLHFPNGINSGSTPPSGGIPNVPTLECWKIAVTDDNRDSTMEFISTYLNWGMQGRMMSTTHLLSSEYDMDIILPGAEIYGGSGPWPECLYEIYILLYKKCFDADMQYDYFLERINAAQGEKITLNEWLEITALAKNWME